MTASVRTAEQQRGVDTAAAERIAEKILGIGRPARTADVIQVASGIGGLQIDGGRKPAVPAGQGADGGLDGTTRAERMTVIPLGAAHRQGAGALTEHLLDRGSLGRVVEGRRGAVRVDVAHVARRHMAQRQPHGARGLAPVGAGRRHVMRVVGEAIATYLRIDRRAARQRPAPFLENQHRRALAHYEAIASHVERPAGAGGIVVAGGHRPNDGEGSEAQWRQWRLGPPGDHHIGIVVQNGPVAVPDGDRT
jgi:hypothetical protein